MKTVLSFKIAMAVVVSSILTFNILTAQSINSDSINSGDRLSEVKMLLDADREGALHWWYGWIAAYSVATIGQGAVYLGTDNKSLQQDMLLGSATTFLGVMGQLLTPLVPKNYLNESDNPEYFEEMLKEIARREKEGRSWKIHAVTGLVNLGSGLITWKGFHRSFLDGVGIFALNTAVTELQIWTQPTRAVKDYRRHVAKYGLESFGSETGSRNLFLVNAYPGGISIKYYF